jgi:hypothetical protein
MALPGRAVAGLKEFFISLGGPQPMTTPVGMTIYLEIDDFSRQLSFCNKFVIPTGAHPDYLPRLTIRLLRP